MESKDNYFILSTGLERLYISSYNNAYEVGDIVKISGEKKNLDFITLESEFDFEEHLNKKGIYNSLKTTNIKLIFQNPIKIHKYKNDFLSHFDKESASIISAIMFNDADRNSTYYQNASNLHLTRLISASGIYVYFFFGVANRLLSIKLKDKWARLIATLLLLPYVIFTFKKFAIIKIFIFFLLRWINDYSLKKKFSYLTLLSLLAIAFLLIDFHLAYQDSFILGFFIPLFVYFVRNIFHFKRRFINKLLLILSLFIFFIPFELSYFNEIALFSPAYQIILSPFFIFGSILSSLCFIRIPLYSFVNHYYEFLNNVFIVFNKINPKVFGPSLNDSFIILYYSLYLSLLYFMEIKLIPLKKVALTAFVFFNLLYFVPMKNIISEEVVFINVGQGSSTLIRKGTISILIDTGGNIKKDIATNVLIPFLKKKRIYNLDLVMTTHDDFDHAGALSSLSSNFKLRSYIKSQSDFPLSIGGIKFTNYNYTYSTSDNNLSSLVISFKLCHLDFLIMGDTPKEIERKIMNDNKSIPCDVLQVGHHGSNTSTSDAFIKYLKPKEAIVSCGKNNNYGHPHNEVLKILMNNNIRIRRTDIEGSISYASYSF